MERYDDEGDIIIVPLSRKSLWPRYINVAVWGLAWSLACFAAGAVWSSKQAERGSAISLMDAVERSIKELERTGE